MVELVNMTCSCLLVCSIACRSVNVSAWLLQALNIPTKINKGTVEIAADVQLIQEGNKVGASEATLLAKLGIKPFSYGLVIRQVQPMPCFHHKRVVGN